MNPAPDWATVRISHLDLTLAWMVCRTASNGAISQVASEFGLPASIVQKALDRVEAAMGGRAFFVIGKKRTSKLSDDGRRFIPQADAMIEAWNATLSVDTAS